MTLFPYGRRRTPSRIRGEQVSLVLKVWFRSFTRGIGWT
jgi:hypothetical protein